MDNVILLLIRTRKIKKTPEPDVFYGACDAIRTHDLLITSELLCQLSHTSLYLVLIYFTLISLILQYIKSASAYIVSLLPTVIQSILLSATKMIIIRAAAN